MKTEEEVAENGYNFSLNKKEVEKLDEFQEMCFEIEEYAFRKEHPLEAFNSKLHFQYIFSYTGIGINCAVECTTLGIGINLTDYNSW